MTQDSDTRTYDIVIFHIVILSYCHMIMIDYLSRKRRRVIVRVMMVCLCGWLLTMFVCLYSTVSYVCVYTDYLFCYTTTYCIIPRYRVQCSVYMLCLDLLGCGTTDDRRTKGCVWGLFVSTPCSTQRCWTSQKVRRVIGSQDF